ncbi:unnamed protein product, partial [Meganyctiphanes norvegica]
MVQEKNRYTDFRLFSKFNYSPVKKKGYLERRMFYLTLGPKKFNPRFQHYVTLDLKYNQETKILFTVRNPTKMKRIFIMTLVSLPRLVSRSGWRKRLYDLIFYYKTPFSKNRKTISFFYLWKLAEASFYRVITSFLFYSLLQCYIVTCKYRTLHFFTCNYFSTTYFQNSCPNEGFLMRNNITPALKQQVIDLKDQGHTETTHHADDLACDFEGFDNDSHNMHSGSGRGSTQPGPAKRVVVILARIHGGESPSSYIVQGMIEKLLGNNPIARTLRQYVVFLIVPMINPDGVHLGNYRSSVIGQDLNRLWGNPSHFGHPTVYAMRNLIMTLNEAPWCELDLVLDIHAHTSLLGTFVYGNSYDDVYRHERHIVFPKMMSHACPDYCADNTIYNKDPAKAQSARRWLCENLKDNSNVYSIHTSIYGYKNGHGRIIPYTEDSYLGVGGNLVKAILDYYNFLGLIPQVAGRSLPSLSQNDMPKRKTTVTHTQTRRKETQLGQMLKVRELVTRMRAALTAAEEEQEQNRSLITRGRNKAKTKDSDSLTKNIPSVRFDKAESSPRGTYNADGVAVEEVSNSGSSDEGEAEGSGHISNNRSDTSGLMVRISHRPTWTDDENADDDNDEQDENEQVNQNKDTLDVPEDDTLHKMPKSKSLDAKLNYVHSQRPRTTYLRLFPDNETIDKSEQQKDDSTSLPDLPSLKTSLPARQTRSNRISVAVQSANSTLSNYQNTSSLPSRNLVRTTSYRYYDFKKITRPRKRRHKRRSKSRSPSRKLQQQRQQQSSQKSPQRSQHGSPTKLSSRRSHHQHSWGAPALPPVLTDTALKEAVSQGNREPTNSPGGFKVIDVNQLTIGGFSSGAELTTRWQSAPPPKRSVATAYYIPPEQQAANNFSSDLEMPQHYTISSTMPPLLKRFLDPQAPLFR